MNSLPSPAPFDPHYDPLIERSPGRNHDYAPTYWIATGGAQPADDGPVSGEIDADVAVIGSGYTGLSCAIHLAREFGISAVVLEANRVAWGCSTRNGGQAQLSAGRLKRSEWMARWGLDTARAMHSEMAEAFELFRGLLQEPEMACDAQHGGHLHIAHRPRLMLKIEAESRLLNEQFNYPSRVLGIGQLREEHLNEQEAVGAMFEPDGIGVHAGKLAFGYLRLARRLGARVHTGSPVLEWSTGGGMHRLSTAGGSVRTRAVAIATGGYTAPSLSPVTRHRLMPVLSNSIVTRPLTSTEVASCGFRSSAFYTDTRTLRHYYRCLPDRRVQIGSRSSITGADASNPRHLQRLRAALGHKFPALAKIEVDYSWWGWVDVSHDLIPRVIQPDATQNVYYALAYGGNGVMYSAQAGRRLAQLVAGSGKLPLLPIFQSQLPGRGVLTPFRRIGQRLLYAWYHVKDEAS